MALENQLLEVEADLTSHVVHVAGKRMTAQGTDGLTRGDKSLGVAQRIAMEADVPLHLRALERSSELRPLLTAAAKGLDPIFLEPEDWFTKGQGPSDERGGCFAQIFAASADPLLLVKVVGVGVASDLRTSSSSQDSRQWMTMVWTNGWLATSCVFWREETETT